MKAQAPFFLGARTSPRSNLWVLAYQTLTLPLSLWRHIHHFRATVEGTEIRIVCVGRRKRFRDLLDGLFGPVEGGPARALVSARLALARSRGYRVGWRLVSPDNRASLRTAEKTGKVKIVGELSYVRILGRLYPREIRYGKRPVLRATQ